MKSKDTHQAESGCAHDTRLHGDVQHHVFKHLRRTLAMSTTPIEGLVDGHHFCMSSSLKEEVLALTLLATCNCILQIFKSKYEK